MLRHALVLILLLCACDVAAPPPSKGGSAPAVSPASTLSPASQVFAQVVSAVQPVAVRECQRRTTGINCDFQVAIAPNRRAPPNAFQSVDDNDRPVLTFTMALINHVQNPDELAFVLSHEAAHHILNHLARQEHNAKDGATAFGELAALTGGDTADVARAQKLGAAVGARSYSKEFELEADELGTIITYRAGYNPLIGAQFFTRLPDPRNIFLSDHPPNAARIDIVRRTSAGLGVPG